MPLPIMRFNLDATSFSQTISRMPHMPLMQSSNQSIAIKMVTSIAGVCESYICGSCPNTGKDPAPAP